MEDLEKMENKAKSSGKVRQLSPEVARKIAAGEVIEKPASIVRELLDNAVDSGATSIVLEIEHGGIEKIRVADNGCGMTKEDLENCARPHATSKISSETDLLKLSTLGFRGEALSSMAGVSRLEIMSGGWKMKASITEDHLLTPHATSQGTVVQTSALFENFPARRVFLKREASEALGCRQVFQEKALPRPDIAFKFVQDGEEKLNLPAGQELKERFLEAMGIFEPEELFYQLQNNESHREFSFTVILGEPSVKRSTKKDIHVYVNGRKIQEYSLVQAIEYGGQGYFPNGTHPVACIFVTMDPSLVDFNIHPAKREARFKDIGPLHHEVSTTVRNFYRQWTVQNLVEDAAQDQTSELDFSEKELPSYSSIHEQKESLPFSATSQIFTGGSTTGHSSSSYGQSKHDLRSRFISASTSSNYSASAGKKLAEMVASFDAQEDLGSESFKTNNFEEKIQLEDGSAFHFVGLALGTFLIAEKDSTLYIIDQHAADERYRYNQIMETLGEKQTLLVPYALRTESEADDNYIQAIQELLEQTGFTCQKKEKGLWEFTTVPVRWKGKESDLARDILDRRVNPKDMINAVAASTACRSAVMDGTVLDKETAALIAKRALELPDPHCPHGRPVYTKITRDQLFALVMRT